MAKLPGSQRPSHTAVLEMGLEGLRTLKGAVQGFVLSSSTSNSIEDSLFKELSKFPAGPHHLANALSSISKDKSFGPDRRGGEFSWYAIGPNILIDIGGSCGGLSNIVADHVERV